MPVTAKQLKFAKDFHARVQQLRRKGDDPWDIFRGMHDQARRFYKLIDAVGNHEMLRLATRYNGIWYYVHILARIAVGSERTLEAVFTRGQGDMGRITPSSVLKAR
jgi:hypothetical protein